MSKKIYTFDYEKEIWSLLGLFESKKYVKQKLKNKFPEIPKENLEYRTEKLTYCIRQAREFFESANKISLLTSPLLLSYGMLNLAKALVYYKESVETNFNNYFNRHGLSVPENEELDSFSKETVELKENGTYPQMVSTYSKSSYSDCSINTKEILSQIPDLYELFVYIYNEPPNVIPLKSIDYGYNISTGDYYDKIAEKLQNTREVLELKGYQFTHYRQNINVTRFASAEKDLKQLGLIFESISGKKYIRFPIIKENSPLLLNENSLHYLLVFCYGMLARYQAAKWGSYIDPNISKEAEIINKSIHVSRRKFQHFIIDCLFEENFEFVFSVGQKKRSKEELLDLLYDDFKEQIFRDITNELRRKGLF